MKQTAPNININRCDLGLSSVVRWLTLALALASAAHAPANPTGLTVRLGSATAQSTGSQMTVTTGSLALLNWSSFNIRNGETTTFNQPSANSVVFNIIGGANASKIYGNLNANGTVILANAHGFYFGPNSFVNVGGNFVATTAPVPADPGLGASWAFTGTPPLASIVNYGQISTSQGHSLYLIAEDVENHGTLIAPGGNVGLCAGQDVLLTEQADGRGLSATVKLPAGSVDNSGRIIADAGTIALNAQVVNQNGVIQADSVREQNGTIELVASDQLNLGPNSQILARGDDSLSGSPGGSVTLKSGNTFADSVGSQIIITGGGQGGNGGRVEVSAPNILSLNSTMNASAQPGSTAGQLFLDPENIILSSTGASATSGMVNETDPPTAGTLTLNPNSLNSFSSVDLQASQNITLSATWNVPATSPMTTLTLQAGNNITFNSGDSLKVQNNASVNLLAGVNNFSSTTYNYNIVTPTSTTGANSITLAGTAGVQTTSGSINLIAGGGITTGTGTIESASGNIRLQAMDQNISLGGTPWVLPDNNSGTPASVTLEAGGYSGLVSGNTTPQQIDGNITIASGGGIKAGQNWSVYLLAGAMFPSTPVTITPDNIEANVTATSTSGASSITLAGSATLQTANDGIYLVAGGGITLGTGTTIKTSGGGSILLDDSQSIALPAAWTLTASPGGTSPTLTLQAGNNITLNSGDSLKVGDNWSVDLIAGANANTGVVTPNSTAGESSISLTGSTEVQTTTGSITLNAGGSVILSGTAYLQTQNGGSIDVTANNNVTLGSGNICTLNGGNINVLATLGSINAGTDNAGYATSSSVFDDVTSSVGGIATAAGGNVALTAGQNIISSPLSVASGQAPGASGAYGSEPGTVTLIAGDQVLGNYVVANGTGSIYAGAQLNNSGNPVVVNGQVQFSNPNANIGNATSVVIGTQTIPGAVTLSLSAGSWNVWAANNIYVAEVFNFNGAFNGKQFANVPPGEFPGDINDTSGLPYNLFNYAPNAAANFWAGNGITLTGVMQDISASKWVPIYPPILTLNAGAGGITIGSTITTTTTSGSSTTTTTTTTGNSIILYPSSQGALQITTRESGDLEGAGFGITMSDSGSPNYANFATGQAITPLHLNDANPVVVNVAGDVDSFSLTVPTFAQIAVGGSTYNFDFTGQNLSASQTTSIKVAGDITYRGDVTSVPLATPPPAALFAPLPGSLLNDLGSDTALVTLHDVQENLLYDAATGMLSFHGVMTQTAQNPEETFLLNPYQVKLNSSGKPVLAANGQPVLEPLTLTAAQKAALATAIPQLYTASLTAGPNNPGLTLNGPGHFAVTAGDIDLGTSGGIQVLEGNSTLTAISPYSAALMINTPGALDMTYSRIANEGLLGSVQLNIGSTLDVGSENTPFSTPNAGIGIFTTGGGGISITATGDVNVDGSRIATYDGGNINIRSTTGNVDAGTGGTGSVNLTGVEINHKTGQLVTLSDDIPGSGILTTTLPGTTAVPGNITINTPEGSINASKGGISQISHNHANTQHSSITLDAGQDINASGSGIIGANLQLNAGGSINGILISSGEITVEAAVNANVTAFAKGDVSISAGGDVSGTVITSGSASVSGEAITASLISQSVTTSGNTTGSAIGVPQSNAPKEDSKVADDASTMAALANEADNDDNKKKKDKTITLAQKSGRVTVILPGKNNTPHS
ncbi:MAG: filamentous hemagglutinin N-terminal domain-containing protein [Verrucomicrobiota bacterium]|jgi:filamentous hemagglutinin family protein